MPFCAALDILSNISKLLDCLDAWEDGGCVKIGRAIGWLFGCGLGGVQGCARGDSLGVSSGGQPGLRTHSVEWTAREVHEV